MGQVPPPSILDAYLAPLQFGGQRCGKWSARAMKIPVSNLSLSDLLFVMKTQGRAVLSCFE